ncbi:MAG: MBL fold metallo-hydrolase, partial [Bacteroidales bacterium]|nr:MBL fold metallo-hydrolase [Bacteroidales bacterium]
MRLSDRIRYVGVNDNKTTLFERQWPLPYGVSYNSYLVVDEKVALIDTAAAQFEREFIANIKSEIGDRPVDYLVVNHMEPDHSALQAVIREVYPDCEIVTNAKAVPMIEGYQGITDNIRVVKEGETLPLGAVNLQFFMVPMVHWPETMVTWCPEEKTLFSGDAFGSFKAVPEDIIDSKSTTFEDYEDEMTRYYASIVGKYGGPVQAALKKLGGIEIGRICSTHGPVWENSIPRVISLYDRLSRYDADHGVC